MEKQPLQYATLIYILAIVSLPLCCCGGFGIITSGIAFFIARSELEKFYVNPDAYSNQDNIYTGKIIALVVLIINALYAIYVIYSIYTIGWDVLIEQSQEVMKTYQ
jgi:hypothetical protein